DHDLLLDHALDQKRAVALTPGETLTPVADLGLRQRDQLVTFDAQHLHQPVIVEERVVLRLVGPIRHTHGEKGAVGRERNPLRRLTDGNGLNDPRRFRLDIDQAHGIGIAAARPDVRHGRDLAVGIDDEPVGPQPRRDIAFGVLDLVAVDRQHRNFVVAVAGDQRHLAVRRNGDVARARFVVAQIDLADRRERMAGDGKDRDRSLRAVGDQREGPGAIDRHARGTLPRLQLRRDLGRRGLKIDHRELVVGTVFFGSAGSILDAPVTSAKLSSRAIATLAGGPITLVGAAISAMTLGGVALRSMTVTESAGGLAGTAFTPSMRTAFPSLAESASSPLAPDDRDINAASESAPIPPIWRCMKTSRCADRYSLANAPRTRPHCDHHNKRIGQKRPLRSRASLDHGYAQSPAAAGSGRALAVRSALSRSASKNARSIDCSALSRGSQTVW